MFKMWNGSKCNLILVNLKSSVLASGLFEAKINTNPEPRSLEIFSWTKVTANYFAVLVAAHTPY